MEKRRRWPSQRDGFQGLRDPANDADLRRFNAMTPPWTRYVARDGASCRQDIRERHRMSRHVLEMRSRCSENVQEDVHLGSRGAKRAASACVIPSRW